VRHNENVNLDGFNAREMVVFSRLSSPSKIQRFLDEELGYSQEREGDTCRSPRLVLRHGEAQCIEGAIFAAAALRVQGFPPLIVDLEAVRDDDHVVAVFRQRGHWGDIAKSNYSGLRFREPVYRTLRELVMSYFEHYYNPKGEKTLRAYSRPISLARFDSIHWMTAEEDVWAIPEYLVAIPHRPVLTREMEHRLTRMDQRLFAAGRLWAAE
jgi:hypothetical protein